MIGDVVRKIRSQRKMKIKDLAVTAGVTNSLISQIENNKANPSINTLMAIARALDVPISALFEEDDHLEPVVRADNRKMLKTESGVTYYLMTPDMQSHQVGLVYNVFEKGGGGEFYSHEGEEAGFVLEGRLEVIHGNRHYILEAGDSIIIDSTQPHKCVNIHDGRTIAVWANCLPTW